MKLNRDLPEKRWAAYTIATCSAVLLYVLLMNLPAILAGFRVFIGYFSPVLIGTVIAYILNPIAKVVDHVLFSHTWARRRAWILSCVIAIVGVAVFLVVLMVALVPQLVSSIATFINNAGTYAEQARSLIKGLSDIAAQHNIDISSYTSGVENIVSDIVGLIPSNIINTSFNIGKSVITWVISCILAIYFLIDKDSIKFALTRLFRAVLPEKQYASCASFLHRSNSILVRYVAFDLLDGFIVSISNYLFMKVGGMQYATLLSVVVGVTNLAPTFGPLVGTIVGGFILVLINPWHALWFLLFTLVLQTIDGYVLKPRLFGGSLGVASVWILVLLIVGGRMFGVAGILLAIPMAAIISFLINDFVARREHVNDEEEVVGGDNNAGE